MKFAWVPPGTSLLGGGGGKRGQAPFALTAGLWCGVHPVTQAQWQAIMGGNPSAFAGNPQFPVERVSYRDAEKFIAELNARCRGQGLAYRLPTEQEWEFICRGGPVSEAQSAFHFYFATSKTDLAPVPTNDLSSADANFDGSRPAGIAPAVPHLGRPCDVGSHLPNPLGICDMHGNVWEWTSSHEADGQRVIRGGSWLNYGIQCAASDRNRRDPDNARNNLGFRLLAVVAGR